MNPHSTDSNGSASSKKLSKHVVTLSVTSGKGGVGKTLTSINIALAARRLGHSVLILDGDMGLANVDVVLGLQPRYNINDVIQGNVKFEQVILDGPLGIKVVPSGSGVASLANLTPMQKLFISDELQKMHGLYDVVVIDTGAGICDNVVYCNQMADRHVVVTTPEPHAMTDAYALMKVLSESSGVRDFFLVVNQTRSQEEGLRVAERLAGVAKSFLDATVAYVGSVPHDGQLQRCVMKRSVGGQEAAHTLAGQAWLQLSRNILSLSRVGEEGVQSLRHTRKHAELWQRVMEPIPDWRKSIAVGA